jgi:hypothetical protein
MLSSRRAVWGAALTAMLFALGCAGADGTTGPAGPAGKDGATGATGEKGDTGDKGDKGDKGDTPTLVNDVSGAVTDGTNPLEGVDVTITGGASTKTDANGAFKLTGLDVGAYELTFHLDGYFDQTMFVGVASSGPTTVNVALAIDVASGTPPAVSVTDNLLAGFGKSVSLMATATGKAPLTYTWEQTSGPEVTITGATTNTITFTTQSFAEAMGEHTHENARFGTLGVNPDQAGNYAFEVTVKDADGRETTTAVHVNATRPTTGLRMVPVGVPVWLQGDGPLVSATQTTWNWTLNKTGASGSTATLANPTSQFPSFIPDKTGTYVLTETVSAKSLTVYAGTWFGSETPDGSMPSLCSTCHGNLPQATDQWTPFKDTNHYWGLQKKLDGVSTQHFTEECLSCHTVGYDKTASNGGFDDLEAQSSWTFPTTLKAGNWDQLVNDPKLGVVAGIQCENCHGPQLGPSGGPHTSSTKPTGADTGARISWSSDVCGSCHQEEPYHYKPGQWAESKHASLELAYYDATVEARGTTAAHCGRCHTAQGYAQYVSQLQQGYTGNLTTDGKPANGSNTATITSLTNLGLTQATVQSQTCAACHDPHNATNPAQLRIYDTVPGLPNGLGKISGMGSGMICATCHNTRNGAHNDSVPLTSYSAPHVPSQTDMLFGFNTYFTPQYNPSAHLAVGDTCAGCHFKVATGSQLASGQDRNHSFKVDNTICSSCHSANTDGEGLAALNETQLMGLESAIAGKIASLINNELTANGAYTIRVWDPTTDLYSSSSASNVSLTTAPSSVSLYEVHGQAGFILHMPTAMSFTLTDGSTSAPSNDVYLQGGSLKNAAASTALFSAGSDLMKAMWNYYYLHGDGTHGIHNPSFFNKVVSASIEKVSALP